MPSGKHEVHVYVPIEAVWTFVSQINNWAPLVPRYVDHQILNDEQSTWTLNGDIGIVEKNIKLKVMITEWSSPSKISFTLDGIHDNVSGSGYFKAQQINEQETKMIGFMKLTAKGFMSPVINNVLKTFLPKTTKTFTESIKENITNRETVSVKA